MDMQREFVHWISPGGNIVDVSDSCLAFARNNGRVIESKNVVGHHGSEYIKSPEVRKFYQRLMEHVRATGQPVRLHYRCDSPEQKCFHQMKIAWDRRGRVYEFRNGIVETEDLMNATNLTLVQGGAEDDAPEPCTWLNGLSSMHRHGLD